ncbi:MAG: TatD family nuclease-associated radical SAM protein [Endomicrobium sp.]|nr:TatD family nuclease-associated radical SAM protein [Endomicrobium sp.]
MSKISYVYGDNLYLNITNRCMMSCPYCIKRKWDNKFRGDNLKLEREPSYKEVILAIKDPKEYSEIVFCGYGDSLVNVETVKEISKWIKDNGGKVRVNTAGLANRYHSRNILPELKGFIDVISISLNGSNPKEYNEINRPMFKEESFNEVVKFAKEAKKCVPKVVITAVESLGFDISKVREIAEELGVQFKVRPYLTDEN